MLTREQILHDATEARNVGIFGRDALVIATPRAGATQMPAEDPNAAPMAFAFAHLAALAANTNTPHPRPRAG
ncbi:hypothetical protein [Azospirillum rugosum]|uniref:Uncharacterized protein n=1 Tax=Azospirillum rugosum TaxID=416170 RepID=A0ABS4SEY3_9PROT|nr:hypothetical protein [Azospirillum rugosum]MBP2290749.1 hypothetical protein [Azospirillum rugosum]MDQ0525638.1 hypothetical protein [Azospirillum rugosum]